jgi:kumamolisin
MLPGDRHAFARGPALASRIPRQSPSEVGSLRERSGTPAGCADGQNTGPTPAESGFTPNQYLSAYGHAALHARGLRGRGERIAVVEIDGFIPADIEAFAECFGLESPPIRTHLVGIDNPLPPGSETTLDLEVLTAAAPGVDAIDVYEGEASTAGILASVAAALDAPAGRRASVISISLGGCEPGLTGQRAFWRGMNHAFAIAAGAGISTLVAAGDTGSSGCRMGEEAAALGILAASYPSTSPYVTAVGGTNLELDAGNRIVEEIAWGDAPILTAGGGGGLSILSNRPWWQRGIPDHIANGARAVPDVAGLADVLPGYAIFCTTADCPAGGGWTSIGGTSAATPLFAAGVALASQAARERGQPALGLINPLINRIGVNGPAGVFFDVRTGSNDLGTTIPPDAGGGAPLGCCSAQRGYDLASGWGSINFPAFVDAAIDAFRDR